MSALDRLKLLGDRADPLTRWQAESELQTEAERGQERKAMAECEQVQALRHEIANLRHELANVQARLVERDKEFIGIAGTIVAGLDKVSGWVEKSIEARVLRSQAEMAEKIATRFGELMGRLAVLDPTQARTARGEPFRFANEKSAEREDEPVELPNPLPPRRVIN